MEPNKENPFDEISLEEAVEILYQQAIRYRKVSEPGISEPRYSPPAPPTPQEKTTEADKLVEHINYQKNNGKEKAPFTK